MAEQTPAGPAEAPKAPESLADTSTNLNQPAEQTPAPAPDMHGFTSEDLAGMRKFIDNNGGWSAIKSRISNPTPQPAQSQPAQQPETPVQPQPTSQPQQPEKPAPLPKGFVSQAELNVERYFKDLASEEKYSAIADKITSGDVLKEMASMGMNPIDDNYNINAVQVRQFLDLKAAAQPAQPASAPITTTPLADYIQVGENIVSKDEALSVLQQSYALEAQGLAPHPAKAKAEEFIKQNWGKK